MQRKQQAQKLTALIEAMDLDAGLERCLEVLSLKAPTVEEWLKVKAMNDNRQQFLTLVNTVANMGPLEYKVERNGQPAGESGDRQTGRS